MSAPTAASAKDPEEPPQRDANACLLPDENLAPVMVAIRPGRFWMGSPGDEEGRDGDESPQHGVTIPRPFALSRCEITLAQFRRFVAEAQYVSSAQRESSQGCNIWNPEKKKSEWSKQAFWDKPGFAQTEQHPVVCISFDDAQAYVDWLSQKTGAVYRLPTEAEWEYAARADSESARYFGKDAKRQCEFANGLGLEGKAIADKNWTLADCDDTFVYTAPVASLGPNAFQLYDMLGNAWEWTLDCWHNSYENAPKDGSAWLEADGGDCKQRVVRGGSWLNYLPRFLRSAFRLRDATDDAYGDQGFRVARDF